MQSDVYFCIFCPQKWSTNDIKPLRQHLKNYHLKEQKSEQWMDWLIEYEIQLNANLQKEPQILPPICLTNANSNNDLLKGCVLCDRIDDVFKLSVNRRNNTRHKCVCGEGREAFTKMVVNCKQCHRLYHWDCVEPHGYKGSELSQYKCSKCKDKRFEISSLTSIDSQPVQTIHVRSHLNYKHVVCKAPVGQMSLCGQKFYSLNFFKTHLKHEHKIEDQISNYFAKEEIEIVEKLIASCLNKLSVPKPIPLDNNNGQEINGSSNQNKRLRIDTNMTTASSSRYNSTKISNINRSTAIGPPPVLEPPILVNQRFYTTTSQPVPPTGKRKRGRPRKNPPPDIQNDPEFISNSTSANLSMQNKYIADGNPQIKSRLSEDSRLSRSNISLSREEEKALKNKKKVSQNKTENKSRDSDESSGWDSDIEKFDLNNRRISKNTSKSPTKATQSPRKPQNNNTQTSSVASTSNVSGEVENGRPSMTSSQTNTPLTSTRIIRIEGENEVELDHIQTPQTSRISTLRLPIVGNPNTNQTNTGSPISDWLFNTKPKKFPYFPQLYDKLVYIPYGHKCYVDAVRVLHHYNSYTIKQAKQAETGSSDVIYCKVKKIEFVKKSNVRFAKMSLIIIDSQSEKETTQIMTVRFHDIDNVLDFLILRQMYDRSLANNWKPGDHFRAIVEDKWWFGNIVDWNVKDHNMRTQFQCLNIVWANGSTEQLSFWDLERIEGSMPQNSKESSDVTDKDRQKFYEPTPDEWPVCGKVEECKRIVEGLTQIMELTEYKELIEVFNRYNNQYMDIIAYPIDLEIVLERTRNQFYRRHAALKNDIKFLSKNAEMFDKKHSTSLTTKALIVVAVSLKFIDNNNAKDIKQTYDEVIATGDFQKYRFYSCVRPFLNPTANRNSHSSLFPNNCYNILTPSTSNPLVSSFDTNSSDVQIIEISDSEEESDENSSNNRVQQMVDEMEPFVVSPTAPDSPPTTPVKHVSKTGTTKPSPKPTQPVLPVSRVQQNDGQPSGESSTSPPNRYFCIFCDKWLSNRAEALIHYSYEQNIRLECSHCSQEFESLEQFKDHNRDHIRLVKPAILKQMYESYENGMDWVKKFFTYLDGLNNTLTIQNEIDQRFGDFCLVCKNLNRMTPDSQKIFNDIVFKNKRSESKNHKDSKKEFRQHLMSHLRYEPIHVCKMCVCQKRSADRVFRSKEIDDKCCQHVKNEHQMLPESPEDVIEFFNSTSIESLDEMIDDTCNSFVINTFTY